MAIERNTVELVLKARDEMSLVYKDVIKLSEELEGAQKSLKATFFGSSKASAVLADGLGKVGRANKGIDATSKAIDKLVAGESKLQAMAKEAGRLRTALAELEDASRLSREAGVDPAIAKDFNQLSAAAEKTSTKLAETNTKLKALKEAATAAALAQNRQNLDKAIAQQKKLSTSYDAQRVALRELVVTERTRTTTNTAAAEASLARINKLYLEQQERVTKLAAAKGKNGEQTASQTQRLQSAERQLAKYGAQQAAAASALDKAKAAQEAFNRSVVSSGAVAKQLKGMRDTANSSRQAAAEVKRLASELGNVTFSPKATNQISKLEGEIEALGQHYTLLSREADKAGAAMAKSLGPVDKRTAQSIREVGTALAKTEAQIAGSEAELDDLRSSLRAAGVDVERLDQAQDKLAESAKRLKAAQQGLGTTTRNNASGLAVLRGETRKALGPAQRLRGEVLALASAYIGLYGIFNQVQTLFNTAGEQESIAVRLGVFFDGDAAKVADEMAFIEAEASRLKLSMIGLGTEYSKFVAGLPPGQIELEQTRKIFSAYAQSSRVLGLSNEELQRVFKALTQIISKGTLSAEELRQQLGDNLAGSVQVFAQGMGYAADETEQFFKAIEGGQIGGLDSIIGSVDVLNEKFADQLPEALNTSKAALSDFQLAVEELRLKVAEGGFLDTLTEALQDAAAELRKPETIAALGELADNIGGLIDVSVALIPYLDEIATGFAVLVAGGMLRYIIRLAGWFVTAGGAIAAFSKSSAGLNSLIGVLGTGFKGLLSVTKNMVGGLGSLVGKLKSLAGPVGVFLASLAALDALDKRASQSREAIFQSVKALLDIDRDLADGLFKNVVDKSDEQLGAMEEAVKERLSQIQTALDDARAANEAVRLIPGLDGVEEASIKKLEEAYMRYANTLMRVQTQIQINDLTPQSIEEAPATLSKTTESVKSLSAALEDLANTRADQRISAINAAAEAGAAELAAEQNNALQLEQLESQRVAQVLETAALRRQQVLEIRAQEVDAQLALMRNGDSKEDRLLQIKRDKLAKLAGDRVELTKDALDQIESELARALTAERNHANAVQALQQGMASERERQAAVIRGIESAGQNDAERSAARRQQIARLGAAFEKAFAEKRYADAEKLARQRETLAAEEGRANLQALSDSASLLDKAIARNKATREAKKAQEQITKAQQASLKSEVAAQGVSQQRLEVLKAAGAERRSQLDDLQNDAIVLQTEIDEAKLKEEIEQVFVEANRTPAGLEVRLNDKVVKAALKELTKPLKTTLEVVVKTTGGTDILRRAKGGPVPGFAGGGDVRGPGTSTSDSILAWLSNNEFVMRASSVQLAARLFGRDFLKNLNAGRINKLNLPGYAKGGPVQKLQIPRFASGGPVTRSSVSNSNNGAGSGQRVTLDLVINNQELGDLTGSSDTVGGLIDALHHLQR